MLCGVRHGVISGADMFESGAPTVQPGACKVQFTAKEGKVTDCSLYSHRNWFLLTFYKYGMSIFEVVFKWFAVLHSRFHFRVESLVDLFCFRREFETLKENQNV